MNDYAGLISQISHCKWQHDNLLNRFFLPQEAKCWLTDQGSLTASLKEMSSGTFEVQLISQKKSVPYWHEAKKLGLEPNAIALTREVFLKIQGRPVVYARSIIPMSLALPGRFGLNNLGKTPLGHLLFKDGRIRVSRREFSTIEMPDSKQRISARRTPYDYRGHSILVSEFFLPNFNDILDQS